MPGSYTVFSYRVPKPLLFGLPSVWKGLRFGFLLLFYIAGLSAVSGEEAPIAPKMKELPKNQAPAPEGNWEIGARFGWGIRGPNRFDQNLNGFSSTLDPRIPSSTTQENNRMMTQGEMFARTKFGENFKVGFLGGFRYFQNFHLTNVTTEPFYTRLDFGMESIYFLAMVWQEGRFNRLLRWEAGLGMGYAQALWTTKGYATDGKDFYSQEGNLKGSGMEFRLEGSLNAPITDTVTLSFGTYLSWINIASFDGSFNGDYASIYIRQDGRVSPLTESSNQDNILLSNQYSRKLDMQSAYGGLFFGVNYKL